MAIDTTTRLLGSFAACGALLGCELAPAPAYPPPPPAFGSLPPGAPPTLAMGPTAPLGGPVPPGAPPTLAMGPTAPLGGPVPPGAPPTLAMGPTAPMLGPMQPVAPLPPPGWGQPAIGYPPPEGSFAPPWASPAQPLATPHSPPPPTPPLAAAPVTSPHGEDPPEDTSAHHAPHDDGGSAHSLPPPSSAHASVEGRSHGGLFIPAKPEPRAVIDRDRVTSDTEGDASASGRRVWIGEPVPAFVPAGFEAFELSQLRRVDRGYFAFYRTMFGDPAKGHCELGSAKNCRYQGHLYSRHGALEAELDFNAMMPSEEHLRVSNFTFDGSVLYFAQECASYSKEAKGKCSNVIAVDFGSGEPEVRWRSNFLVSNAPLLVVGDYLVTGYGFTNEPDFVHVLDRSTGKLLHKRKVPTAPNGFEREDDVLLVYLYGRSEPLRLQLVRFFDSKDARGKKVPAKPSLTNLK